MTQTAIDNIRGWVSTQAFRESFTEFVSDEIQQRLVLLRSLVRNGDSHQAALLEGEILALENLGPRLVEIASSKVPLKG